MRIGFYIKWPKDSLVAGGNVLGDELIALSMCRWLSRHPGLTSCELFAPNHFPSERQDFMIYLNDTPPVPEWANKHVLWVQNAHEDGGSRGMLERFRRMNYQGFAFVSRELLVIHETLGGSGLFLPFGVDMDVFYPRPSERRYAHDVSYLGNDIKGELRTMRYLFPAVAFDFGLYGNWPLGHRFLFWRNRKYQRRFSRLSRGKLPLEDVPILYSSSKINLNCTAQDSVNWNVITLRTYEVLACRGFLITDRVPAAEKELADCAVFTDGAQDLSEKLRFYLNHPEERERISRNGYQYVVRYAGIRTRAEALLKYLRQL